MKKFKNCVMKFTINRPAASGKWPGGAKKRGRRPQYRYRIHRKSSLNVGFLPYMKMPTR